MGKALRVFVILILLLSIAALVFGILLFQKRELLKGRTQMVENYLIRVASTLEAQEPVKPEEPPTDPERDISPVTSEPVPDPQRAAFWENYRYELESMDQPLVDLNKRRAQLMQYYKIDPITQKAARDPNYGHKLTTGEGTMHEVMEDTLAKSEAQYNRLNETREQLRILREELISAITELNTEKSMRRDRLAHIVQLNQQIASLERRISDLQQQIAMLEEEKRALKDDIAERDRTIEQKDQEIKEAEVAIKRLEQRIRDMERNITRPTESQISDAVFVEPGDKGAVVAVNGDWNFVVLKLQPEFVDELLGEDRSRPLPKIDLMLKRPDGSNAFVSKVRLTQLKVDEGLGVADVLVPWRQEPVQAGDVVFY